MDQNQHGQAERGIGAPGHDKNQYQSNPMMAPSNPPTQAVGPSVLSSYPSEQQYASQYIYQPQKERLQEQLNDFWAKQCHEIEETTDFGSRSLPLARIRKIMKTDKDVRMISAETPVLFAKATEMFIQELTKRAWANAEDHKRRMLKKHDILSAISNTDVFDFLEDIVHRDEGIPRTLAAPIENVNLNMPPHQNVAGLPYGDPTMDMGSPIPDLNHHAPNLDD